MQEEASARILGSWCINSSKELAWTPTWWKFAQYEYSNSHTKTSFRCMCESIPYFWWNFFLYKYDHFFYYDNHQDFRIIELVLAMWNSVLVHDITSPFSYLNTQLCMTNYFCDAVPNWPWAIWQERTTEKEWSWQGETQILFWQLLSLKYLCKCQNDFIYLHAGDYVFIKIRWRDNVKQKTC